MWTTVMFSLVLFVWILGSRPSTGFLFDSTDGADKSTAETLAEPPLNLASFNIQVFGHTKIGREDVLDILVQVRDSCK